MWCSAESVICGRPFPIEPLTISVVRLSGFIAHLKYIRLKERGQDCYPLSISVLP